MSVSKCRTSQGPMLSLLTNTDVLWSTQVSGHGLRQQTGWVVVRETERGVVVVASCQRKGAKWACRVGLFGHGRPEAGWRMAISPANHRPLSRMSVEDGISVKFEHTNILRPSLALALGRCPVE